MFSIFDRRFQRLAVASALVVALGLTGCGRKGGLDPPPGVAAVPLSEDGQPLPSSGPEPGAAKNAASGKKNMPILDWLVD